MSDTRNIYGFSSNFFSFDEEGRLNIPELNLVVSPGESVALLGAKGTDIGEVYEKFNSADPLRQHIRRSVTSRAAEAHQPMIHCVTRRGNLFPNFSAYGNFSLADKAVISYSKKKMIELCEGIKKKFGITSDFSIPVKELRVSERIIVDVVRAYLLDMDVFVCDNLFSLMDTDDRNVLIAIINDLLSRGKMVLYLTTKWEFAVQVSSRITVFSDGAFLGEADTESVKKDPQHLLYLISGRSLVEQYSESSNTANLLNMLYTGAEYLTNNYELQDALSFVIENVVQLFGAVSCSIHLVGDSSAHLHRFSYAAHSGPTLSDKFVQARIAKNEPGSLFYASAEDQSFESLFLGGHGDVMSLLCMPIHFKAKIHGLLSVFFDTAVIYDEQQYLYFKSFCREIAIIMETSQLMGSSVLLQESNHRIKNNLQIIISLITIQQMYAQSNPEQRIDDVLGAIVNRVRNIASVHEMLSSRQTGQNSIDLSKIIHRIIQAYELEDIELMVNSESILVPYAKATSLSMVINELVTNSIKYAFRDCDRQDKRIEISCKNSEGSIVITVADNGVGIPSHISVMTSPSIGFSIIRSIVKAELHGEIEVVSTGHGTTAMVTVSLMS